DRLKARLVAKGYTQIFGIDYGDTFSPIAKIASVRLFLSLTAIHSWPLHQLDIKNAFLHGDLDEEVYMEQPPGFLAQGETGLVCHLKKSLYGLKQSPRAWFSRFSSALRQFGMARCGSDHSVFHLSSPVGKKILLIVYVDDIIITGDDSEGIVRLKQYLHKQFQTKDLGRLRYFLGIEVARTLQDIFISQRKYVLDTLEEAGMLGSKPVNSPMDPNQKLVPGQGELYEDPGRYRRLVGKLNYLTITRPDISFPVSVVSQFLSAPCVEHWEAVIRILRYLKGAPGRVLLFQNKGHQHIIGYSNAN
ncbi:Retrovirus-related Pol polyprotein from transposon RE1-like protein, partial [Drosera capensis]